jgi:hypothetical protein
MIMKDQTMNWEDYCPYCYYYENNLDVCTKFHFNLSSKPDVFTIKCAGKYYQPDKNKKSENSEIDIENKKESDLTVEKNIDQREIRGKAGKGSSCENCGRKTNRGRNYRVFYGNATGSRKSGGFGAPSTTITTYYQVKGNKDVFLCHRCVGEKLVKDFKNNTLWVIFFIAAFIFLLIGDVIRLPVTGKLIGIILSFIIILIMFSHDRRLQKRAHEHIDDLINSWDQKDVRVKGDELAKKVIRPLVEKEGYDCIWTRKEYGEMQT